MPIVLRPVALICLMALTGCSLDRAPPETAAPPPDLTAVPPAAAGDRPPPTAPERSARRSQWHKSGVTPERQKADTEACYNYSQAQVDNDIRIDDDIYAARDDLFSFRSREQDLRRRADSFYYERQRGLRFEECMKSRGYSLI